MKTRPFLLLSLLLILVFSAPARESGLFRSYRAGEDPERTADPDEFLALDIDASKQGPGHSDERLWDSGMKVRAYSFLARQATGVWNPQKPEKFGRLRPVAGDKGDQVGPGSLTRQHLVRLTAGKMVVEFDKRTGAIYSIKEKDGRFGTNYMGNAENHPGTDPSAPFWTGQIVSTTWELDLPEKPVVLIPSFSFKPSGKWRTELSGRSGDTRRVSFDGETFTVQYKGVSKNEGGIKSYNLTMTYHFAEDDSLLWDMDIENTTGRILEIGELGLPFAVNDFYDSVREKNPYTNEKDDHSVLYEDERLKITEQRLVHEQRVIGHHFIGGHSSYSLVQRLLGDSPFLLVHPTKETAFECKYRFMDSTQGAQRRGLPDVLALHSWATKNLRGWRTPWVNGHTSLILKPGEKKSFQMRFTFVDRYESVREELYKHGNLGIRILPSMVLQENTPVYVEIKSKHDPEIEFLSDNIFIKDKKRKDEKTLLTLSFRGRGQKTLKLVYDGTKWTNLHFYCTEDVERLIKARAKFIIRRQFYDNPDDPYYRHHMFLPFDFQTGSTYRDSDSVWEVGGNDEYGFSEPVFLAEKNVYYPDKEEVEILEAYVDDCLFNYIQNPETYALRASLYWKERYPSSPWGHWTEARSKETYRTYNYPHAVNVYHALYRIGKLYGLTTRRDPLEYLRMAYRTSIKWFNTGPWRHVGVMGGSNVLNVLEDLKKEGLKDEYNNLLKEIKECHQVFLDTPYPYSSELFVDQTAHEQVYFFTRYFGSQEKNLLTLQVLKALRGGNQPVWFRYGNDKRGDTACWYSESLNGMPLLKGFEDTGDMDMFIKGYAGVMSVTANLLPDGMGFGRFSAAPGVFAHVPPRTQDNGIGMYGYFKSAKAYIINDESFGLIGCGSNVQSSQAKIKIFPTDGLKKRILLVEENIDLEAVQGEIQSLVFDRSDHALELQMTDSTHLVDTAVIIVKGLDEGDYRVTFGNLTSILHNSGSMELTVPMHEAGRIRITKA